MDYSRSILHLPQCEPTGHEIEVIRNEDGGVREIHHIRMTGQEHAHCSECNCKTYRHLTRTTELKHFSLSGTQVCLSVEYEINRCPVCGRLMDGQALDLCLSAQRKEPGLKERMDMASGPADAKQQHVKQMSCAVKNAVKVILAGI